VRPLVARLLRGSAALTLTGLALMAWSVVQPTPLPTILAMSLGQVIGTTAFALYLVAIGLDLREDVRDGRERVAARPEPPP
jgi:hypothetical protein